MGQILRMDQALDCLEQSDAGGNEDCEHHGTARELLATHAAQKEGDTKRHGSERISEVVNQIGKERDTAADEVDRCLGERRCDEGCEADRDSANAFPRAHDRRVDESVRVAVLDVVMVVIVVAVIVVMMRPLKGRQRRCVLRVATHLLTVPA